MKDSRCSNVPTILQLRAPFDEPIEFWSEDRKFGLRLERQHVRQLVELASSTSRDETGGVLIGHYTDRLDCAVVTRVVPPPSDSSAGKSWFRRGTALLRELIAGYWRRGQGYYVGEWHLHPGGSPVPSSTDAQSMREIAESEQTACPQPVLLIIGDAAPSWSMSATVFPVKSSAVTLRHAR